MLVTNLGRRAALLLGVLWLLGGCAASQPTASTDTTTNRPAARPAPAVTDPLLADVARFRPKIDAAAPKSPVSNAPVPAAGAGGDVTVRADAQLQAWADANQQLKFAPGFRILAYTGPSRDEAMRIRTAVIRRDPTERDYLLYEQPTFRLKIGDYFTRLEAEQALVRWRDVMPQALIVAEQVNVR